MGVVGCRCDQETSKVQLLLKESLDQLTSNSIAILDLTGRSLGDTGAVVLGDALKGNSSLRSLCLRWNSIQDRGASALALALKGSQLNSFDVFCNSFGNSGVRHLVRALEANRWLYQLDLGWNSVGDDGAAALADFLTRNVTLSDLGLEQNVIAERGARYLAEALQHNVSLEKLRLNGNPLGEVGLQALKMVRPDVDMLTERSGVPEKPNKASDSERAFRLSLGLTRQTCGG